MVNKIQRIRIKSGAIASNVATAYSSNITGRILAVHVNYPTNNCLVDIDTDGELKSQKMLDLSSANSDAVYYPRTYAQDETGTDLVYDTSNDKVPVEFVVHGRLKLSITSGTNGEEVTVDVIYEAY